MTQQENLSDSTSPVVSRGSSVVGQNKSLISPPDSLSSVVGRMSYVYQDITNDTHSLYCLDSAGTFVYYLKNRSGEITFSLECPEARVYLFGVFEGKGSDSFYLKTVQNHLAQRSESKVLIKSVLRGNAHLNYSGNILIAKTAQRSRADLENRNLLVGEKAGAETKPFLEILADDVECHHSATTAPLSREHLAYLSGRGIQQAQAEELLIKGFLQDMEEKIETIKNTRQ